MDYFAVIMCAFFGALACFGIAARRSKTESTLDIEPDSVNIKLNNQEKGK